MVWRRSAAAACALVLALTGCTSPPQAPDPSPVAAPDPRARSQYTVVWAESAGFDLLSAEGTYVRGSVESLRLSAGNGNRDAAYPGFWKTLIGAAKPYADGFLDLGPDDVLHGVARYEVVEFSQHDQRFDVGVCTFERQLGTEDDHRFVFSRQGSYYWRLTVDRTGAAAPPANQRGRDTFPRSAVFGTWRTVEWARPAQGEPDPCQGRPTPGVAPDSWPAVVPGSQPYLTDRPPVAPNYPGWSNNVT